MCVCVEMWVGTGGGGTIVFVDGGTRRVELKRLAGSRTAREVRQCCECVCCCFKTSFSAAGGNPVGQVVESSGEAIVRYGIVVARGVATSYSNQKKKKDVLELTFE